MLPGFKSLFAAALLLAYSPFVFWPYLAVTVLLVVGVLEISKDLSSAHGLDRVVLFGGVFYAVPLAAFGAEHLSAAKAIMQIVPPWMPARLFWAYFVGVCLVAAALSIASKKYVRLSATLVGIMLGLFVLTIHIPSVIATPHDRTRWVVALRDSSFAAGAFALAGTQTQEWLVRGRHTLIAFARIVFGGAAIVFGIEHFLYARFAPGVPLGLEIPSWIPLHIFWAYLAGMVLSVGGACLLLKKNARLAATAIGIICFLLVICVYLPLLVVKPSDIAVAFNYVFDTLMYSGAALLLAGAMPHERSSLGPVAHDQSSNRDAVAVP